MKGFLRIGEFTNITVLDRAKLNRLLPKASGEFCLKETCPFQSPDTFAYEPERYLYFRARAISADVPNKNGDFFSWDELTKACESFIGKGFYLNHDSDSPTKAKGIILDAQLNDEGKYIETLVAVDRGIAPEVCQLIESGIINSVSMGCMAARAMCSVCNNEAYNQETLCEHMSPKSANYVKGKKLNDGSRAFEHNFDIGFTELSGVSVPADGEAHIFEIFASEKSNNALSSHLDAYKVVKAAKEKDKEDKPKEEKAEKPGGRPAAKTPDSLEQAIEKTEDQMPKKVIEFFMKYVNDSLMKLLKVKLGDEAAVLQSAISDELSKEVDLVADPIKSEIKKYLSGKPGLKTEEPKKEMEAPKPPMPEAPKPEEPKLPAASHFDLGWFRKEFVSKVDSEFKRHAAKDDVLEVKPEEILNVPGLDTVSLVYDEGSKMYNIVEDGKKLPGFVSVKEDDIDDKQIKENTEPMDLISRLVKGKERSVSDIGGTQMDKVQEVKQEVEPAEAVVEAPAKVEEAIAPTSSLNIMYVPGFTPASSFFVGREGDSKEKVKTISAALVMPTDIQKRLLEAAVAGTEEDPSDILSPEEVIEQIKSSCKTYDEFVKFAEESEKNGLERSAEWAIMESEVMTVPLPKPGEVIKAVKESEAKADAKEESLPAEQGSEVKKYYARLPGSGSGEPEKALNLQSDANIKYKKLVADYEQEKKDKEAALKELENLKKSSEETEKEKLVTAIVSIMQEHKKIANEDEKKEVINQLAKLPKAALVSMQNLLEKTSSADPKDAKSPMNMGENLPQVFASFENAKTMVETMSDIWNK